LEGPVLRFEVVADPEGNISVRTAWPCDRAEVRDLCLKVANACNSGDRDVTFRESLAAL
jgi:hypothetical protein